MSAEENLSKSRRFVEEFFNKGNLNAADEYLAANFVDHNPFPGQAPGLEGLKQGFSAFRQSFPDLHMTIDDLFAAGDKVVMRVTMKGTHKGSFMNMPPTGKQFNMEGMDIVRISGGKAVEHWGLMDALTMMQQLGAVPTA